MPLGGGAINGRRTVEWETEMPTIPTTKKSESGSRRPASRQVRCFHDAAFPSLNGAGRSVLRRFRPVVFIALLAAPIIGFPPSCAAQSSHVGNGGRSEQNQQAVRAEDIAAIKVAIGKIESRVATVETTQAAGRDITNFDKWAIYLLIFLAFAPYIIGKLAWIVAGVAKRKMFGGKR